MVDSVFRCIDINGAESVDDLFITIKGKSYRELCSFLENKIICPPDEILLFHLSRRLHGLEDDIEGKNLADLLTTDNALTEFLKSANIVFSRSEQHIDVQYKNKLVDWEKCQTGSPRYMKRRLGHCPGHEDYCFNGFAFKDLLCHNAYYDRLCNMPEFLEGLIKCLGCKEVGENYKNNSMYYCYEYKIPLKYVIFDGYEKYSHHQKQIHLLYCVLQRIAHYQERNARDMSDRDNPILRLGDSDTVPARYCIGKERII